MDCPALEKILSRYLADAVPYVRDQILQDMGAHMGAVCGVCWATFLCIINISTLRLDDICV